MSYTLQKFPISLSLSLSLSLSRSLREGDLRVVRPFVYVREKDLRHFADSCPLPVIAENCPACFEAPKVSQSIYSHSTKLITIDVKKKKEKEHKKNVCCHLQERHRMKQLLAAQELLFPKLFASLQAAMRPLMARSRTGMEGGTTSRLLNQTGLDFDDNDDDA